MKTLTVGELKKRLKNVPDNTPILRKTLDYSRDLVTFYNPVTFSKNTVLYDKKNSAWMEDFGEDHTPEKEFGKRVNVITME